MAGPIGSDDDVFSFNYYLEDADWSRGRKSDGFTSEEGEEAPVLPAFDLARVGVDLAL
jgi:hypothetical protein